MKVKKKNCDCNYRLIFLIDFKTKQIKCNLKCSKIKNKKDRVEAAPNICFLFLISLAISLSHFEKLEAANLRMAESFSDHILTKLTKQEILSLVL